MFVVIRMRMRRYTRFIETFQALRELQFRNDVALTVAFGCLSQPE